MTTVRKKHIQEINEIRELINTYSYGENYRIKRIQEKEFINFAGITKDIAGLPVNIFLDQCASYVKFKHPFWLYFSNSYCDDDDLIPINIEDLKVWADPNEIKIYQSDLTEILCFILKYKKELYDITNDRMDVVDFCNQLIYSDASAINEDKQLLTELSRITTKLTGLPFDVWIGPNTKQHFVGVKFPPNAQTTNTNEYAEMSIDDYKIHSSKPCEQWRVNYVKALIDANRNKLIDLGKNPSNYYKIISTLTKIDNNYQPIITQPQWIPVSKEKMGVTRVKNSDGLFNFIKNGQIVYTDNWFDAASDVTKTKQGRIRAFTILNGTEGFLYVSPVVQWTPVSNEEL